MHCSRRLSVFSLSYLHRQVSPPETLVVKGGTTWARNGRWILPENARLPCNIHGSFTCCKSTAWNKRLYFPSEGRCAEDFFALKIRRLRPGLSLRTRIPEAYSRPPKPLLLQYHKKGNVSPTTKNSNSLVHVVSHLRFFYVLMVRFDVWGRESAMDRKYLWEA